MADSSQSKMDAETSKTTPLTGAGKKPNERWLLTRKTWRYMSDAKSSGIGRKLRDKSSNTSELATLKQQFQEMCSQSREFLLWEPTRYPTGYKQEARITVSLQQQSTLIDERSPTDCTSPHHSRQSDAASLQSVDSNCVPSASESQDFETFNFSAESTMQLVSSSNSSDAFFQNRSFEWAWQHQAQPNAVRVPAVTPVVDLAAASTSGTASLPSKLGMVSDQLVQQESADGRALWHETKGTQTEESCFFDLVIKRRLGCDENASASVETLESTASSNNGGQEDKSRQQTFSNAVMKYFGMGRKKTEKDKKDRFKTINYDRNLRNIKSKNVDVDTLEEKERNPPSSEHHESESSNGACSDIDACIGIQVGESVVYSWLSSSSKQSKQNDAAPQHPQPKVAPDKPLRPKDWTGTKLRKTQSASTPASTPTASAPVTAQSQTSNVVQQSTCPAPQLRRRKMTIVSSSSTASTPDLPPPESVFLSAAAFQPQMTNAATQNKRCTNSPRYSIANSEDSVCRDATLFSNSREDHELIHAYNPAFMNESESVEGVACDLDSDLELRRPSMDINDHLEYFLPDLGSSHVSIGDQFHQAKYLQRRGTDLSTCLQPMCNEQSPSTTLCNNLTVKTPKEPTSGSLQHSSDNIGEDKGRGTGRRKASPLSTAAHHVASGLHLNSLLSAVMLKSKSGGSLVASAAGPVASAHSASGTKESTGHSGRIMAKKIWKTRSKSQSRATSSSTCIWTPQGDCKWTSITGRQVILTDTTLLHLSEIERLTLQKVALAKLQALNLGVTLRPPSESAPSGHKPKRRAHLLRKRGLSGGGFFDGSKKDYMNKDRPCGGGLVFGIPIDQCIANEKEARLRAAGTTNGAGGTTGDFNINQNPESSSMIRKTSHGSRTSFGSLIEGLRPDKGGSCESLNGERKRSSSLSCSSTDFLTEETSVTCPRVPAIVSVCFNHLELYGLNTLGIFRVSSSKKRVRQLREDFDGGKEIFISEDCCPHDVATLVKEFFRDLPEPLLTRELYAGFVQTQKIRNRRLQMEALQHLIQLLPVSNRDTLHGLLHFLANVAAQATDHRGPTGEWVQGNKMDSNNLATLFAPNILHTVKPGTSPEKIAAESVARADERIDVINVIRSMIDHHKEIFQVSAVLLDEVYVHLYDSHPEALDRLLRRRCQNDEVHEDLDTSSSVFEGSECSSVPRTPTYDDTPNKFCVGNSESTTCPSTCSTIRKWSQGSENSISIPIDIASTNTSQMQRTRYRKREDILHENGGTGGRFTSTRERRREEQRPEHRYRITETSRSRTDLSLGTVSSIKKRADSVESPTRNVATEIMSRTPPQTIMSRPVLSRERSEPTIERRIVVQPVHIHGPQSGLLKPLRSSSDHSLIEGERLERRLSSPAVNASSVITASLRIPVTAASTSGPDKIKGSSNLVGKSFTVENEHDIPFIEDNSSSQDDSSLTKSDKSGSDKTTRQRSSVGSLKSSTSTIDAKAIGEQSRSQWSGSNDSYLSQLTSNNTQTTAPSRTSGVTERQNRDAVAVKSASHDSVLSAASFFSSPPATPLSPTSSSNTSLPPTSSPLSYDYHSPPNSPTPELQKPSHHRREKTTVHRRSSGEPSTSENAHEKHVTGVMRSKTADIERMTGVGRSHHVTASAKEEWLKKERLKSADLSAALATGAAAHDDMDLQKKAKKKYVGSRNQTDYLPSAMTRQAAALDPATAGSSRMTSVLRKRWEIIASNPDGPETLV